MPEQVRPIDLDIEARYGGLFHEVWGKGRASGRPKSARIPKGHAGAPSWPFYQPMYPSVEGQTSSRQ